ncbi:MAG: aspartate/glutamate racemase family protein [Rhodospirillales bacterium]|jgi:hypothetical protein|nr:aspartate/glutamate racemase family protein [Rhodospirillales bacterium]MDP6883463.1 aspartate/glutamate racemase family protein [Rhodospirillales bacterium]
MKRADTMTRDLEGRQSGSASDRVTGHGRMAHGGKSVYGARIGILMLDMEIPRIPGDMGNAGTWPFPVLFRTVRGANRDWIHEAKREEVFQAFCDDALGLVAEAADGIAICCGMMSLYQDELAERCRVPVVTSSLIQVPFVERLLPPGKRVGILTVSTNLLKPKHLEAAGVAPETPIMGFEDSDEFIAMRRRTDPIMDVAKVESETLAIAQRLVADHPDLGALVMECTNLPPFSRAVSEATGLPVFDIYNFLCWFHAGLAPRDFGHPGSAPRDWRER